MSSCSEVEVSTPVDLCLPDGSLNPEALGWSRFPLHRANLSGSFLRKKRWDYWCIVSSELIVSAVIADIDYATLASVWILDVSTRVETKSEIFIPPWSCCAGSISTLSEIPCVGSLNAQSSTLSLSIEEQREATLLCAVLRDRSSHIPIAAIDLSIARPPGHETLSVVVPWSFSQFQYTSKHNSRPVTGRVRVGTNVWNLGSPTMGYLEACEYENIYMDVVGLL